MMRTQQTARSLLGAALNLSKPAGCSEAVRAKPYVQPELLGDVQVQINAESDSFHLASAQLKQLSR